MLDRDSPIPIWHQIELALSAEIRAGALLPGARLPAEAEIAARFGVNRHTARRALATLAEKGALHVRRGHGTFVAEAPIDYRIGRDTRFTANLLQQNRLASHDLLGAADGPADAATAAALALPPGTTVTTLHVLGRADGMPINLAFTAVPAARFPGFAALYREHRSMTACFARYGLGDFRRASTRIAAITPTREEAAMLRQPPRAPALAVESIDVDAAGRPVSFSRVRFAGDRVQLTVEESVQGGPGIP